MRNFPLVLVQYCYSFILVLVLGGWGSRSRTSLVLDQNWLSWRDDLETKTVEFTEALDGPGHFLWHSLILLQLRSWSWRAAKLLMKCITKILASCGIVWGMKAGCWLRYYHCHHHSHASDPTRWAIGITCHNVGRFSTMKGFFFTRFPNRGCMGLLQLWLQFVSHQCQWEQWMPQVVEGNDRTIGRGPSKTASHVTWAHLVIEQPTAWGPWTGPWWHF